MTERKFRKLLQENPFIISDIFIRSYSEAEKFAKKSKLSPELVVQRAKSRLDLSDECWENAETTLCRVRKRERLMGWLIKGRNNNLGSIRFYRRLAVVCVLAIIALAFFVVFPSGRTLAKKAFSYAMSIYTNRIEFNEEVIQRRRSFISLFVSSHEDETKEVHGSDDEADLVTLYSSIEEFSSATGKRVVKLSLSDFPCAQVEATMSSLTGLSVRTTYSTPSGTVGIIQKWLIGDGPSIGTSGNFNQTFRILDGVELICTTDIIDGQFEGFAMLSDSMLWVAITKDIRNIEVVLAALEYY